MFIYLVISCDIYAEGEGDVVKAFMSEEKAEQFCVEHYGDFVKEVRIEDFDEFKKG